jgi:methylmalonyl-CoA mutase N-terminal domain/subunit
MSERVNPFASIQDAPVFTTKPRTEKPVEEAAIARIAEDNRFPSRQAAKPAKPERRKPRIHRTGRNQQFNAKATAETISRVYKQADEMKVTLGEWMQRAADALDREGVST